MEFTIGIITFVYNFAIVRHNFGRDRPGGLSGHRLPDADYPDHVPGYGGGLPAGVKLFHWNRGGGAEPPALLCGQGVSADRYRLATC